MESLVSLVNNKAAGVAIIHEEKVLLAKRCETWQGKPASLGGYWSIFGGALEEGENLMLCAVRELQEESGIQINISDLNYIKEIMGPRSCFVIYGCTLEKQPNVVLNDEHTDFIWFTLDDIENFPHKIKSDLVECLCLYRKRIRDLKKIFN